VRRSRKSVSRGLQNLFTIFYKDPPRKAMSFNPYVPTDAIPPPYFAGRREILDRAGVLLANARRGIHGGLLLSGHRGIGKTSVLRAVEAMLPPDVAVIRIRFSRKASLADFAAEVVGHIRAERRTWRERFGIKELELPFLTVKMSPVALGEVTPQLAILEAFRALNRVPVLWLSLDDMDWVQGDALSLLKSAMEESVRPTSVVCIAAGPQVRQRLVSEHSPIIRFFTGSDFGLGNLTLGETREALTLPLVKNRVRSRWTEEGVAALYQWTGGYPYLAQCLAYASFQEGVIDKGTVDRALPAALRAAGTWMNHELVAASDTDIRVLDRLGAAHRLEWRTQELLDAGVHSVYIARLEKLGALRKVRRGRYLMMKPPMIARYHMWKRGLDTASSEGTLGVSGRAP
jgi:hypothetical protein